MVKLIASDIDGTLLSYGETALPSALFDLIRRLRSAGVQIEALAEYVALYQQGEATLGARRALLAGQREQLAARMAEMQRSLDRLDEKIRRYDLGLAGSAPQSPGAPLC